MTFINIIDKECSDHGQGTQFIKCFNKLETIFEIPIKSPNNSSEPRSCSLALQGFDPYLICHLQQHKGNVLVSESEAIAKHKYKFNIWIHSPTSKFSHIVDHYSISKTFNMYANAGKSIIQNECLLTSLYGKAFTMLISLNLTSKNVIQKKNITSSNQESSIKYHQGILKIFLRSANNKSPALQYANITLNKNCSFSVTSVESSQYNTTYFCCINSGVNWTSSTTARHCKYNSTFFGAAQYPSNNYFITSDPKTTYGRVGPGINIHGSFIPLASKAAGIAYSSCTDIQGGTGAICVYESDTCFNPNYCIVSFLIGNFPKEVPTESTPTDTSKQFTTTTETTTATTSTTAGFECKTEKVPPSQPRGHGLTVTISLLVLQSCAILCFFAYSYRQQLKRQLLIALHKSIK